VKASLEAEGTLGGELLVVSLIAKVVSTASTAVQFSKRTAGTETLISLNNDIIVIIMEEVDELELTWSKVAGWRMVLGISCLFL